MKIKAGLGYDIHKLAPGRPLYLGGIEVPFTKGLLGHSDGDCLIHAITDAVLGALGEKDIGQLFPDSDPQNKSRRSMEFLKAAVLKLQKKKGQILHVDTVVIAQEPQLAALIPRMKEALCSVLEIGREDIGIKAKTNEGIGGIGRGEAIAAWAHVLVSLSPKKKALE